MRRPFYDTMQQALTFLVSQTTFIEPQVIRIKYPELNYADFVPIDGLANEWAKSVTFFSLDMVGQADWFSPQARDVLRMLPRRAVSLGETAPTSSTHLAQ